MHLLNLVREYEYGRTKFSMYMAGNLRRGHDDKDSDEDEEGSTSEGPQRHHNDLDPWQPLFIWLAP